MHASGLAPGPDFDKLIRGPVVRQKRSAPQNGAFEELITGPAKSYQAVQQNVVKKRPEFTGPLVNSWPARLLTLEIARFTLIFGSLKSAETTIFVV